jgi:hypothetical protein
MKAWHLYFLVIFANEALAARWDRSNNPDLFNPVAKSRMVKNFSELPLRGELKDHRMGWSETYWPSNLGGIAYRWNHPDPRPFKYNLLSKDELLKLGADELSMLSPSELYDIAMNDYNYSLTKKVLKLFSPSDLWWEGICHGWSLAATHYPEPDKTVLVNKDGIRVPFGASDVKGLLSMHDAYNSKGTYVRIGDRCMVKGKVKGEELPEDGPVGIPAKKDADRPECSDVNAGAFHIVLASMIGINSQGFVADVDRFNDVWNQPVTSYESQVVGVILPSPREIKEGIVSRLQVKTIMTYGEELVFYSDEEAANGTLNFVSKEPVTGTPAQAFTSKNYEYILDLNKRGEIIGGEWLSETRPDMLWMKAKDMRFNSSKLPLEGLNQIYRPVEK